MSSSMVASMDQQNNKTGVPFCVRCGRFGCSIETCREITNVGGREIKNNFCTRCNLYGHVWRQCKHKTQWCKRCGRHNHTSERCSETMSVIGVPIAELQRFCNKCGVFNCRNCAPPTNNGGGGASNWGQDYQQQPQQRQFQPQNQPQQQRQFQPHQQAKPQNDNFMDELFNNRDLFMDFIQTCLLYTSPSPRD